MRNRENSNQKAWLGIFLVTIGAYFLLRNFGMIPHFIPHYIFGWEMILIVIGGSMLLTGRREGFIFLLIGSLFLVPDIFHFPHFRVRDWWPIILIIIGVSIVVSRRDHRRRETGEIDDDYFTDTAILGGSEKAYNSKNFKGGKITSIFGGSDISFAEVELGEQEAVLDVFCLFGGNSLTVPQDWTVIDETFVIFGGYADKRSKSDVPTDPKKVLRIKGSVVFGGAEVKGA